jgi:DNA-binding PadR family transcriptional regulator
MRYPFLALLADRPAHGYELKQELESRFGDVLPPLNAGQIYTTLGRLERDGLVSSEGVEQNGRPNKRVYELTVAGRRAVEAWVEEPTPGPKLRDDFFMKLVLAAGTGLADPQELIDRRRRSLLQALRDLDGHRSRLPDAANPAGELLVEGASLHLEADLRWLDLCEQRLTDKEN